MIDERTSREPRKDLGQIRQGQCKRFLAKTREQCLMARLPGYTWASNVPFNDVLSNY